MREPDPEIYEEGQRDFERGLHLGDNPYSLYVGLYAFPTSKSEDWKEGWNAAYQAKLDAIQALIAKAKGQ